MSDENMQDNNDESIEHHEHEEEFSEDFNFEESEIPEDLEAADEEAISEDAEMPPPQKHKSTLMPLIIGAAVVGYLGWKGYGWLTAPKKMSSDIAETKPAKVAETPQPKLEAKPEPAEGQLTQPSETQPAEAQIAQPTEPTQPAQPTEPTAGLPSLETPAPSTQPSTTPSLTEAPSPTAQPTTPTLEKPATTEQAAAAPLTPSTPSAAMPSTPQVAPTAPTPTTPQSSSTAPTTAPTPTTPQISSTETRTIVEEKPKFVVSNEAVVALQHKLEQQEQLHKQQIIELEKNLKAATQTSENANKGMAILQQQVANLSNAVRDLATEIKKTHQNQVQAQSLAKQEAAKQLVRKTPPKISHKIESFSNPSLTVHAIIPGRAWLRTPDGKTITVTEGDPISEYGKVLKIDAPNGMVITTSGVTLR